MQFPATEYRHGLDEHSSLCDLDDSPAHCKTSEFHMGGVGPTKIPSRGGVPLPDRAFE